jgi:hypothetical protein
MFQFQKQTLDFQKQTLQFQGFVIKQFKKQEQFNERMDKCQPTWFKEWVQTDFKPLETRLETLEVKIDNIQIRIDNLVKVNDLRE